MKDSKYIDHTLLKAFSTEDQILKLCEEASLYDFKSVCVNPCWVSLAKEVLHKTGVLVCTVIGFPLGANTTDVKCYETDLYSEEGFLDVRKNPLYLTNHARERMYERMGINDSRRMNELAFEAYQFGKSKMQLMKSERGIIEEKEQEYGDSVILIYRGYCYVFTENNGLKTVYKNDRVRA